MITKRTKVEPQHVVFAAIVAGVFTWFTFSALGAGQIRMGVSGHSSRIITMQAEPTNYWFSVGWFLFFSAMGWFAVGLSACRLVRNKFRTRRANDLDIDG